MERAGQTMRKTSRHSWANPTPTKLRRSICSSLKLATMSGSVTIVALSIRRDTRRCAHKITPAVIGTSPGQRWACTTTLPTYEKSKRSLKSKRSSTSATVRGPSSCSTAWLTLRAHFSPTVCTRQCFSHPAFTFQLTQLVILASASMTPT